MTPAAAKFPNREAWLNHVATALRPLFAGAGASLPAVRIAIAFPSTGRRGKRIGECWDKSASADGTFEIMIRPDVDDPLEACAILAHELVHAAVGIPAGHRKDFRRVAVAIGLTGPMRSTTAGPEFVASTAAILAEAGPIPHARLNFDGLSDKPKKQGTRLVKCVCEDCGYVVRVARKWIEDKGPPLCPEHGPMTADLPTEDSGEDENDE